MAKLIYSIGHSTHPAGEFIELLQAHGITKVIDIRTIPKSRHNPQFNQVELSHALASAGITYQHLKELGGLRHTSKESPNQGWKNASFRGFADYMQTEDFAAGLEQLKQLAAEEKAAMMCAEAVPWRCHRSLVADALVVAGWQVLHIQTKKTAGPHQLTAFLRVEDGKLTYPALHFLNQSHTP